MWEGDSAQFHDDHMSERMHCGCLNAYFMSFNISQMLDCLLICHFCILSVGHSKSQSLFMFGTETRIIFDAVCEVHLCRCPDHLTRFRIVCGNLNNLVGVM